MKMVESSPKVSKTLWGKKEKLLVTSNFSFSHRVFKSLVPQTRKHNGLSGKGLNKNTVGKKEKLLVTSNFSFFPTAFVTLLEIFPPFSSNLELLRAISPFPTEFSKVLYCRHVKTMACLGKGLTKRNLLETILILLEKLSPSPLKDSNNGEPILR